MGQLVRCVECNNKLSENASICPHCKTDYPHGSSCDFCNKDLKMSEAVQIEGSADSVFHYSCKSKLLEINQEESRAIIPSPKKIRCPTCGKGEYEIPFFRTTRPGKRHEFSCKSCGEVFSHEIPESEWPFGECYFCRKFVIKSEAVKCKDGISSNYWYFAHKACHELPENKQAFFEFERQRYRHSLVSTGTDAVGCGPLFGLVIPFVFVGLICLIISPSFGGSLLAMLGILSLAKGIYEFLRFIKYC